MYKVGRVAANPAPIAGVGDIEFKQRLRQTIRGPLPGVIVILRWYAVETGNEQVGSTSHHVSGGSHPGGGASGVAL